MCYKYLTDTPTALRNEVKPKQEEVIKNDAPIEKPIAKPLHRYSHIKFV